MPAPVLASAGQRIRGSRAAAGQLRSHVSVPISARCHQSLAAVLRLAPRMGAKDDPAQRTRQGAPVRARDPCAGSKRTTHCAALEPAGMQLRPPPPRSPGAARGHAALYLRARAAPRPAVPQGRPGHAETVPLHQASPPVPAPLWNGAVGQAPAATALAQFFNSRTTRSWAKTINPLQRATVPTRIMVLPKLNSLTGMPNTIAAAPPSTAQIPASNNAIIIKPTPKAAHSTRASLATILPYCAHGQSLASAAI